MVDLYVGPENTHWVLHEKLLCARSSHFRSIFYSPTRSPGSAKTYGLPDDDDDAFRAFVGWLYSGVVPAPHQESDLGICFELYLMSEKFGVEGLRTDVLNVVRAWYRDSNTYPGLRRVQYVYANTEEGSEMRGLLVGSIARMLVLGSGGLPKHWDKALRKNGQLAVDILTMTQRWGLEEETVPDVRQDKEIDVELKPREEQLTNGIGGEVKQVKEVQGDKFQKKVLDELPSGLTNGAYGTLNGGSKHGHPNGLPNGIDGLSVD